MHCQLNKSQPPYHGQENLCGLISAFCPDFLSHHPLPRSSDSRATGFVFVSQIFQASSCFKAIVFPVPSAWKLFPQIFICLATSHYSCLQEQPMPSQTSSIMCSCFLFLAAFFSCLKFGLHVNFCLPPVEYYLHEGRNLCGLSQYPIYSKKFLLYIRDLITIW